MVDSEESSLQQDWSGDRGKIIQIELEKLPNRKNLYRYGLVELVKAKEKEPGKYYVCLKKENAKKKVFNLIYRFRHDVFQYLEQSFVADQDDYIGDKFSLWEEEKKSDNEIRRNNEGEYECIVLKKKSQIEYFGWSRTSPLTLIKINYDDNDNPDNYYLLREKEIINFKYLEDCKAMEWNNRASVEEDIQELPTWLDKEDYDRKYQQFGMGIQRETYVERKDQYNVELEEILKNFYTDNKKWIFIQPESENKRDMNKKNILQTHSFLFEKAQIKKLRLIFDKDLIPIDESISGYRTPQWNPKYSEKLFTEKRIEMILSTIYSLASRLIGSSINQLNGKNWFVLCDERKRKKDNILVLMYSIILPRKYFPEAARLPTTTAFYHGSDPSFRPETKSLQKSIYLNERILNFSFEISNWVDQSDENRDTAMMISNTFPIIVEIIGNLFLKTNEIAQKNGEKEKLNLIFINERIDTLNYDIGANIVIETNDKITKFYNEEKNLLINFDTYSLPKNPNSHPYLQYPDIIGRKYDYGNFNDRNYIKSIKTFSGDINTFKQIKEILLNPSNPIEFFEQLIESKNEELADYCVDINSPRYYQDILQKKIDENIEKLDEEKGLVHLFNRIRLNSDNEYSRRMRRNILRRIFGKFSDNSALSQVLPPDYNLTTNQQFEWLMQRFEYEKNSDNFKAASEIRKQLEELEQTNKLIDVHKERIQNMKNLFIVADQNNFLFDTFDKNEIDMIINRSSSKEEDWKVGSMALSLLLNCKNSDNVDFELAKKGEEYLLKKIIDDKYNPTLSRRFTNRIEMNIIKNLTENPIGDGLMSESVLQEIHDNQSLYEDYYSENSFFMAAILKTIALTDLSNSNNNQLEQFTKKIIDTHCFIKYEPDYPNNRVAYWFIRAYFNIYPEKIELSIDNFWRIEKCSQLLFKMIKSGGFRNVKGLMTICELIDIYHRFGNNKWCEEIFNKNGNMAIDDLWKKYENTLNTQHTAPSTREWFKQNKPDEDDWLKPLNFNYR